MVNLRRSVVKFVDVANCYPLDQRIVVKFNVFDYQLCKYDKIVLHPWQLNHVILELSSITINSSIVIQSHRRCKCSIMFSNFSFIEMSNNSCLGTSFPFRFVANIETPQSSFAELVDMMEYVCLYENQVAHNTSLCIQDLLNFEKFAYYYLNALPYVANEKIKEEMKKIMDNIKLDSNYDFKPDLSNICHMLQYFIDQHNLQRAEKRLKFLQTLKDNMEKGETPIQQHFDQNSSTTTNSISASQTNSETDTF